MQNKKVTPYCLKDAPALIEVLFPAQKISNESYKEQSAVQSKTLTGLGSYWIGRKPLVLNKACILGALLPVTADHHKDLEVFEMLMGMDRLSLVARRPRLKPKELVAQLALEDIYAYFEVEPVDSLPKASPLDVDDYAVMKGRRQVVPKLAWREDVPEASRRALEAQCLPDEPYRLAIGDALRAEQCPEVAAHIWPVVNAHLGTDAHSMPELVEQLGVMRYGHRPRVADVFSGSGQIPFEAARLGCDAYASDLSPVACLLTWGAGNIVGAPPDRREKLDEAIASVIDAVSHRIAELEIETDGEGWQAKTYLYCLEAVCKESGGWRVPMLPTLLVSKARRAILRLVPDEGQRRYDIEVVQGVSDEALNAAAAAGTIQSEGRGAPTYLVHTLKGKAYRTKVEALRGDYQVEGNKSANRLRHWEQSDFCARPDDIFRERLYAVQWQKTLTRGGKSKTVSEFRAVTAADLAREARVEQYVAERLAQWHAEGLVSDAVIEKGMETERLYRERGWTHWHHLFAPRQLLFLALVRAQMRAHPEYEAEFAVLFARLLDWSTKLCRYGTGAARESVAQTFYNQAFNTFYNYGVRSFNFAQTYLSFDLPSYPVKTNLQVRPHPANALETDNDIYVTDPPYGDAVRYEEIFEFFIAWLRKNPPKAFEHWGRWDSRRALAVTGEDHNFKLGMVAAYKRTMEKMPDNGIQVLMFTHQSGAIWADMANIVWASGLQVSAAWYVVTETDSPLRDGSYVKGTVLLVLRKRRGRHVTFRDDLALELRDEVEAQVKTLTGLNQEASDLYRDENLFSDSDLQMAGYAAALRVLTRYAEIDGVDMTVEALRPREKGQKTRVDTLIDYAVEIANQCLIPAGIPEGHWSRLQPAERFYLKMLDLEAHKLSALDNYQNFAKAFKVKNFHALMASERANHASLKSSVEFGRAEMGGESELADTPLRAVLYALMELDKEVDSDIVLAHLADNVPDYFQKRETLVAIADFMAGRLQGIRETEASHARVLRELVRNERLAAAA